LIPVLLSEKLLFRLLLNRRVVTSGYRVRLVVVRSGFNSLAKSDQKTLTVGIHNFSAWRSGLKRLRREQTGKFTSCVLEQATELNGIASTLEWLEW